MSYRVIYCIGSDTRAPRLSGLAIHDEEANVNYVPPEPHQTSADFGPDRLSSMIAIQGSLPPGKELPDSVKTEYAWGFQFHDSCWKLLEQACAPHPVDVRALWRILLSVPYSSDVPNWGHSYGGLYLQRRRAHGDRHHFLVLGGASALLIPSVYHCPFEIPEITQRLAQSRNKHNANGPVKEEFPPVAPVGATSTALDPFSRLPVELREMILTYVATEDVLSFRLASRGIAAISLSQHFFRSRFWPGRELDMLFDGFLLRPADKAGIDWKEFYRSSKSRIERNGVGLSERNRLRIWRQTVRPLRQAMDDVARLSDLKGGSGRAQTPDNASSDSLSCIHILDSDSLKHHAWQTEISLPLRIEAIHVSLMDFFSKKYVTGLAFTTEQGEDIEIGYIFRGHEEPILVEDSLQGFHVMVDECGFRSFAPYTQQNMQSEYLDWVGDDIGLPYHTIKGYGGVIRKLRATFDVRLQYLFSSSLPLHNRTELTHL